MTRVVRRDVEGVSTRIGEGSEKSGPGFPTSHTHARTHARSVRFLRGGAAAELGLGCV